MMAIKTNNHARDVLYWHDLTDSERAEFDYLDTEDRQLDATFARYRGHAYDLGEFMYIDKRTAPHPQREGWENWDGYHADSYFSAVLIRYVDHRGGVIFATAYQ